MSDLRRHVPRLVLSWDDEAPGERYRVLEGTLVFADISGFTALTERLSRRGRIGAEEIVETLNRGFGAMLDTALGRGADLLKFGGDALLLLFRGDHHADRACDAVLEMRTALKDAAAVPTSVGRLRLSMSVGVHSGPIHLLLVGAPTRELVVLGPAATSTADAEKAATAGEIVVTPGTAALRPHGATRMRDDGVLLLRRRNAAHAPVGQDPVPEVPSDRLLTVFPRESGAYLAPGPPEPEHRVATIGFVRVSGTDRRLVEAGIESVAGDLHVVITELERCLGQESVTLLSTDLGSDGVGFFLGSGVPHSSEDDEGRMLRALRRFVDSNLPLPVQAGCNRGHVFVAEVGTGVRAAYSAMGDTTNTAARIMSKAQPGLLYAHPAVLEHSRTLFASEPAGPFEMKGKALPLLVYSVGEEAGTREREEAGRLPLIGREGELATLVDAIRLGLGGGPGAVTVSGATGMGKSRLVREALEQGPATTIMTVRAEPYGAQSSYRVFRDPVRRLLGIERGEPHAMGRALVAGLARLAPDLVPLAPLLADVVHVDVDATDESNAIDPQYRPEVVARLLLDLVGRTIPGPLVLIAEEAHWADRASAALLERIALACDGRDWVVIAVRRDTSGGFEPLGGERIDLGPLQPHAIERLILAATEAVPMLPHQVQSIVERAEGNPLFVEEVTRAARAAGSLDQLPASLNAVLTAQIDVLEPEERRVLRTAAVLGRSFRREVLRETLTADGLTSDPGGMGRLSDFFEPDGRTRLRFRNSLIRDAAYEELAYRTRSRLHRSAGLATERLSVDLEADAATLALHFSRAGDPERTWRYARLAGQVARSAYANADAASQYDLALQAARAIEVPTPEVIHTWDVVGELRELAGMLPESVDAYRNAVRLCTSPVQQAEMLARVARAQDRMGARVSALRTVTRARRLVADVADADGRRVRVRLDNLTSVIRLGQEKAALGRQFAMRAAEGARGVDDPETLVQALMGIDHADLIMGRQVDGHNTREALDICVRHGFRARESVARANLGGYAFLAGRWDEAIDWYRSSRAVAVSAGNASGAAETDVNLADVLLSRGEVREAEHVLNDAVRVLRASGMDWEAAYGGMLMARCRLAQGDLAAAETEVTRALDVFHGLDTRMTALEASLVYAEIASAKGQFAEALAIVDEAESAAGEEAGPLGPRSAVQRAVAQIGLGRSDEAQIVVESGLLLAREMGMVQEESSLLDIRAGLLEGRGDETSAARDRTRAEALRGSLGVHA